MAKRKQIEESVAEESVEEPVAEESVEEPVAEESVAEEPVAEESVAEESVAEEPVAEESVAEESVAEEPVEEPVDGSVQGSYRLLNVTIAARGHVYRLGEVVACPSVLSEDVVRALLPTGALEKV